MIVSDKHRYVFVELPRTGSSAVSRELCANYDGREVLKKHATYSDFLRTASDEEKKYFTFSTIRNPMDKIVSLYFKYKNDQRGYENPETFRNNNALIRILMRNQFRFVQSRKATFQEFFRRYYRLPYDDWSSLDHAKMDYVMKFEILGEEFAKVLSKLGIEPVRPLPVANKTIERDTEFWPFYTPDIQPRAQWVFQPYFRQWGYKFPGDWRTEKFMLNHPTQVVVNIGRKIYWRYLR